MPLKTIRNVFLVFSIVFEMLLVLASILYLGVRSVSFVLVLVAGVISSVLIVHNVLRYDKISKTSCSGQAKTDTKLSNF